MTTAHGLQRTYERTGYNTETSRRLIKNALERGRKAKDFPSREREYLMSKANNGTSARVYNSYIFIFSADDYCITMFTTPRWFSKTQYNGKQKVRDPKKNRRMQPDDVDRL